MKHNRDFLLHRMVRVPALAAAIAILLAAFGTQPMFAQCSNSFGTNLTNNNSSGYGTTVEIRALRSLSLCHLWASGYSGGTYSVTIWAHPGGFPWSKSSNPSGINDNNWFCVGSATVTFPSNKTPTGYTEIPVDLSSAS